MGGEGKPGRNPGGRVCWGAYDNPCFEADRGGGAFGDKAGAAVAGRAAVGAGRNRLVGGAAAGRDRRFGGASGDGGAGRGGGAVSAAAAGIHPCGAAVDESQGARGCGSDRVGGGVAVLHRGEGEDGKGSGAGGVCGGWGEAGDAAAAGGGVFEGDCGGAEARDSGAVRCGFGLLCGG
jgi:hypothetical protein